VTIPGSVVNEAIEALEVAVHRLARAIDRPLYLGEPGRGHFRYAKRNSQVMQILKAVRIVSGLRATVHLVRVGHLQEAAVVLRSVQDALQDIQVVDEAHFNESGAKEYQQRLVDEFFEDDVERLQATLAGEDKRVPRVPRKKKLAAIERRLAPAAAGYPIRAALEGVALGLDGYTHCGYAQVMELYSASREREGFNIRGVFEPGRVRTAILWTAQFVHPALNVLAGLLRDAKLPDDAETLLHLRRKLEASEEYPRGSRVRGSVA